MLRRQACSSRRRLLAGPHLQPLHRLADRRDREGQIG